MLSANYSTLRDNLKDYCDQVCDNNEILVVNRKSNRNVVVISLERYTEMEKAERNAMYIAKIDKAFEQLHSGKGKAHDLVEV